jgi:hypothetical protein
MKTFLMTSAMVMAMTTASFAADFDATTFGVNITSGALDFSIDASETDVTSLEVGVTALEHNVGFVDAAVRVALGTEFGDTVYTRAEYTATTLVADGFLVYGDLGTQATTDTAFEGATWLVDATAGVVYTVTPAVGVYVEVTNAWDASADFADLGGATVIGANFDFGANLTVTPSVSREFETGADTNARLEGYIRF